MRRLAFVEKKTKIEFPDQYLIEEFGWMTDLSRIPESCFWIKVYANRDSVNIIVSEDSRNKGLLVGELMPILLPALREEFSRGIEDCCVFQCHNGFYEEVEQRWDFINGAVQSKVFWTKVGSFQNLLDVYFQGWK